LRKLKRLDVQLSLGSFGLGRCSLPVLKQLGCTRLKIRPRFVAANDGSDRMPFACAIVELALALDLGVIAEGVESKRAAGILANIGCHEAQGPYFGAPISSGAFAARLRARFLQQPALSYGPVTAEIKNSRKVT
jgi:EAL domain-containing protein (putative c-di-GMP-specific phosphodiesterase class I)